MKLPDLNLSLHRLENALPAPERALHLARWLIPVCLLVGLFALPVLRWLLPI